MNTHENGDHCWGNQLFVDAEIIGHRLCAEGMRRQDPALFEALRTAQDSEDPAVAAFAQRMADWNFSGIEITPPTTLIEERLELDLDGIEAHLLYAGPAHTPGDVIVHLPNERVVFTGDILFRLCTPIGWEGSYAKWFDALDRLVALDPEVIVPGHGPICGVEGPKEMKAYLEYVRQESQRFFDDGLSALDAARKIDLGPYADWTEPERLIFSVERAYRELRGEPGDPPIDPMPILRSMHELARSMGR